MYKNTSLDQVWCNPIIKLNKSSKSSSRIILGFSDIIMSRLCKRDATKRKIEHMPNIIVMGNALTFKGKPKELVSVKLRGVGRGGATHPQANKVSNSSNVLKYLEECKHTLYSTMHTKILRGMRKKFMMVLLASSGMY